MNRIKVLHFAKTFNRFDFVDVVLRFADKNKFHMHAAVYDKAGNAQLPDYTGSELQIESLGISHGYLSMFTGAWRLSRLLRKHRVQIIHAHHFYESVMAMMACWLVPSCKLVVGRHYHNEFYLTANGFKLRYYLFAEAWVNKSAYVIISPSSLINELLESQSVPRSKVAHVPYGFDFNAPKYQPVAETDKAAIRRQYGLGSSYLIGNFSRHHSIKGQVFLLEAFSRFIAHTDARLVMVGDGPFRTELESVVRRLNLSDRVIFTGWLEDPHKVLSVVDVVVHPTLQEAFPQIMIETLAMGIPLVISAVSGATDIIKSGHNGVLVEAGNAEQLLEAMIMLKSNPDRARAIGLQGMIDVRRDLRIEHLIGMLEKVYAEAAGKS